MCDDRRVKRGVGGDAPPGTAPEGVRRSRCGAAGALIYVSSFYIGHEGIAKRCSALQQRMVNCKRLLLCDVIHTHALTYFVAIEVRAVTSRIKFEL